MVIYPPSSRATFDQPKWARQDVSSLQPMQYETTHSPEPYTYVAGEMDNNTLESPIEVSDSVIEAAQDKAQVKFIMAMTESICAYRQLAQSQ